MKRQQPKHNNKIVVRHVSKKGKLYKRTITKK
jgi:hypothetical protein